MEPIASTVSSKTSLLGGLEISERDLFVVDDDLGYPFPELVASIKMDAAVSSYPMAAFQTIGGVLRWRSKSEIGDPVIASIAIDVIDLAARFLTVGKKPCQPVLVPLPPVMADSAVSIQHVPPKALAICASENTGGRIVVH